MSGNQLRGHPIELRNDGAWVYSDTLEPTVATWLQRPCGHCGRDNTPEGHDACLGTLAGAMNACCGHGEPDQAYVQFADGSCIRGPNALMCAVALARTP